MPENGKLNKLKIKAYKDKEYSDPVSIDGRDEFTALVNPERFSISHKTDFEKVIGSGQTEGILQFKKTQPKEIEFDLLFDRTGVLEQYQNVQNKTVDEDIEFFQRMVLSYNGDIHQPNYLKINWGSLIFSGRLSDMNIDYKLFNEDGNALRAVAKVKFISATNEELKAAKDKTNSPDLTHVRVVKAGDSLPLMTYKIYGDSKYYLEVAKVNKLSSFRKLIVGQEIVFPPVQKVGVNG